MKLLEPKQLKGLSSLIHAGAKEASRALSIWVGDSVAVLVDELQEVPLSQATEQLGQEDEIVCVCVMRFSSEPILRPRDESTQGMTIGLSGQILLGFDDTSGLQLSDRLLSRHEKSIKWGELEKSAVMETTNIVGCAFLNAMANSISGSDDRGTWMPSPPIFVRDYAAAIMQFALMGQALQQDTAMVARTQLVIDGRPIGWRLLLIPDSSFLARLSSMLS